MKQTYYEVLGIAPDAPAGEIEAAWRTLQSAHATDADARNRAVFAKHAFDTLIDPESRRRYDESLKNAAIPIYVVDEALDRRASPLPKLVLFLLAAGATAYWVTRIPESAKAAPTRATQQQSAQSPTAADPPEVPVVEAEAGPVRLIDRLMPVKKTTTTTVVTTKRELRFDGDNAGLLSKAVKSVFHIAGPAGSGSGVMVAKDKLLTNCHVVVPNANAGRMAAIDPLTGTAYPITEVAWVKFKDACVAYAPGLPGTTIAVGNTGRLAAGDNVFNLGYPGGSRLTASEGSFVKLEDRNGQTFLATSNYCQPGSSGGPLVDAGGNLIGLVTGGRVAGDKACLSLTVETALAVMNETLMPLGMLPKYYESNVTSPLDRH